MKQLMFAGIMATLLSTTTLADTSSMSTTATGMGVLENDYVKAGVNGTAGSFGSGGSTRPGLQYDSTGTGTFPADGAQGDYLTPGSPFDGFAISIDGTNSTNNNARSNTWADADGLTNGDNTLTWTGTNSAHSGWEIEHTYTLGATSEYVDITTGITAGSAADDVYYGRFIDPDAMPESGDTSATDNVLGYGTIPDSNIAFSEATTSRYALGLYSTDSNVDAGISSSWSTEANGYTGSPYTNSDGDSVNYGNGDHTIGLSWHWESVDIGDILTANYAYIFGPSAFEAADTAIDGGAGGGADVTTGDFEDVGSATDAAEGAEEPTVTGTSDPATTYGTWGDWAHDADLPVLTQAQTTHDSSVAAGVQTIDRETTTVVTTPQERSRTSTTSVIDTYSDGSTVTRTTATGTDTETRNNAVTTVTDPGAFTGRADQVTQLNGLKPYKNLGIGQGITSGRTSHDMGNGYSASSNVIGLGGKVITQNGMEVSAGLNRVSTTMSGTDSSTTAKHVVGSAELSKEINGLDVTGNINTASGDMSYDRTIGDFSASGVATSKDTWVGLTVEKATGNIRPFAGVTAGKSGIDLFSETGDVQAALTHDAVDDSYRYATLGVNATTGSIAASFSKDFGDSNATNFGIGIDRELTSNLTLDFSANRRADGNNSSTFLSAGIRIQF